MRFPVPLTTLPFVRSTEARLLDETFAALRGSAGGPAGKQWRRGGTLERVPLQA